MFNLKSATLQNHDTSTMSTYPVKIVCKLDFDAAAWKAAVKDKSIGAYYNRELSNYLSQVTNGKMPYGLCQVNDSARASKGRKEVTVEFLIPWSSMDTVEALGVKGMRYPHLSKEDVRFHLGFGVYHNLVKKEVVNLPAKLSEIYDAKQRSNESGEL